MAQTKLRILFVSGYLPPLGPIGAVRTGKLQDYWRQAGHDVRTLAVSLPTGASTGAVTVHPSTHYLPYEEAGRWITRLKSAIRPSAPDAAAPAPAAPAADGAAMPRLGWSDLYRQIVMFPDRYRAWIGASTRLVRSWQDGWRPDFIYSSGPPHSGQVISARLAAQFGVPWIAELRDLWIGDPYFDRHWALKPFHDWYARKVLSRASGYVVVTEEARAHLSRTTDKPVMLSYNGYDPADFAGMDEVQPLDPGRLTIIHAGVIYPGRRDPTPLFKAIAALGAERRKVRCLFYSDARGSVAGLARQAGIADCVEILEAVPRAQILEVERRADILLECRWNDPAGDGVIPGKLFEYIGARRPILSLGSLTGEAAAIVRDNGLGLVSNDPGAIGAMLRDALTVKAGLGRLPDRPVGDDKFRRDTQFRKIDGLVRDILLSPAPAPGYAKAGIESPNQVSPQ